MFIRARFLDDLCRAGGFLMGTAVLGLLFEGVALGLALVLFGVGAVFYTLGVLRL